MCRRTKYDCAYTFLSKVIKFKELEYLSFSLSCVPFGECLQIYKGYKMIKQDGGDTYIEGSPNRVVSELGALIHYIATQVEEGTSVPYETAINDAINAAKIYKLTEAGMTVPEAIEVLGIAKDYRKVEINTPEGGRETVYGQPSE